MPAGDGFSAEQQHRIDRAIRAAETVSRAEFSVYVGPVDGDPAGFARGLHGALTSPPRSVLVAVDPNEHVLEIVTGAVVRQALADDAVSQVAADMQAAFAGEDLVGGLERGLAQLAEAASRR